MGNGEASPMGSSVGGMSGGRGATNGISWVNRAEHRAKEALSLDAEGDWREQRGVRRGHDQVLPLMTYCNKDGAQGAGSVIICTIRC